MADQPPNKPPQDSPLPTQSPDYFEVPTARPAEDKKANSVEQATKNPSFLEAGKKQSSSIVIGKKNSVVRKNKKKKKKQPTRRAKMKDGEMLRSENFVWKVNRVLGSGGFGDVYKVTKMENMDKKEYAMKTEMIGGDKRMLRLKIEVTVLKQCHDCTDLDKKRHFVEYVDRGITDKFKFLVMGLVGPSLEDIRRQYLLRNYSRATAMNAISQTLRSVSDLHSLGWIHRDIKPANFAVGLADKESIVYMLDFGIARMIFKQNTHEIRAPRSRVKFLGTLRFCARACHLQQEQGRKDDLETWIYMAFELMDVENGLPWKRMADKVEVVKAKEKFFQHVSLKPYKIVPKDFRKILDYVNGLGYADEPDYKFLDGMLKAICNDYDIHPERKLDWIGKLKKKPSKDTEDSSSSDTSSDNKQSGSDETTVSETKEKPSKMKKKSSELLPRKKSIIVSKPSKVTVRKKKSNKNKGK